MPYPTDSVEIDVPGFSWLAGRLCRIHSQMGTNNVVDYVTPTSKGVKIQRVSEGCFSANPLATYELDWRQIEELSAAGEDYTQDDTDQVYGLFISGENMRKLAQLKG